MSVPFSFPLSFFSFHLQELAPADLVMMRHEGRVMYGAANCATMNGLLAYLTENCGGGTSAYVPVCTSVVGEPRRKKPLRSKPL